MTKTHGRKKVYNVKPLRTQKEIDDMRGVLKYSGNFTNGVNRQGERNLMLFDMGCLTGMRASDLIRLRVKDVIKGGTPLIREKKTGKKTHTYINAALLKEIKRYVRIMGLANDDWMFPSRKGHGHISVVQVYRILVAAGHVLGRHDIGSHSMRKTFGYQWYKSGGSIEDLQKILNHSSPAITRRYIGIEQEDIDRKMKNFTF